MILSIAIPFLVISTIMGFWAKKNPNEKSFNRFLLIMLGACTLIESSISQQISLIQSSFIGALSIAYIANLINNKYMQKLLELTALGFMALAAYAQGVDLHNIAITALFVGLCYYCLRTYKKEVTFTMMQIVPVAIAAVYLQNNFITLTIALMAFLGSIRFFIEAKFNYVPKFFIQAYTLLIFMLINSFEQAEFISNMLILLAGSSFMLLSISVDKLIRHKHTIVERLMFLHDLRFTLHIKIFVFNSIAIALCFLVKLGFISIYILIAYVLLVLIYGFAKLWYKENEHNF